MVLLAGVLLQHFADAADQVEAANMCGVPPRRATSMHNTTSGSVFAGG